MNSLGWVYDLAGNRNSQEKLDTSTGDRQVTSYGYDANDRLREQSLEQGGSPVEQVHYGYHQTQQTVKETRGDSASAQVTRRQTFAYDLQGRMAG